MTPALPLALPTGALVSGAWAPLVGGLASLQAAVTLGPPPLPEELLPLLSELPQPARLRTPSATASPLTDARRMTGDTGSSWEWIGLPRHGAARQNACPAVWCVTRFVVKGRTQTHSK